MKITPSHPFDLAVYGDYIFWTDWVLQAVVRANKYTGEEVVKLREGLHEVMGIVAVANDTNACMCPWGFKGQGCNGPRRRIRIMSELLSFV